MTFTHLAIFKLEEILPFIRGDKNDSRGSSKKSILLKYDGKKYRISLGHSKFRLFKKHRKCVSCGRVGNIFVLDRQEGHKKITVYHKKHSNIHLNLYCHYPEDGENYVLMTQDHIIPKSCGGRTHVSNLQPMCVHCNRAKKNIVTNDEIKLLCSTKAGRKALVHQHKYGKKRMNVQKKIAT